MPLLIAFLLVQNIAISGTLKDANGKSLTGVRVAAMSVAGNFLVGTTNTDKDGRYTLELPPGAYYDGAGNFWPTYYTANGSRVVIDGRYTLELPPGAYYDGAGNFWPTYYTANGSRVVVSTSRNGVDFVVNAASLRPLLRREGWPRREEWPPLPVQWDVPPTPLKFPSWPH
jgi:Carboxypeptidase regulatory-like domain